MTQGDRLNTAFNQETGEEQINPTPAKDKDYINTRKYNMLRLGEKITYPHGEGILVSKEGEYARVYNTDSNYTDLVSLNNISFFEDKIDTGGVMSQIWDTMFQEKRMELLGKAKIQTPEKFVYKIWYDLPQELRSVLKSMPGETTGGFTREPGVTRDNESQENRMAKDKPVAVKDLEKAFLDEKKEKGKSDWEYWQTRLTDAGYSKEQATQVISMWETKSDVEHNSLGGITTNQEPLDATSDYEEDTREGDRKQTQHEKLSEPKETTKYIDRETEISHKLNTRWGPRYGVTKADFDENKIV